MTTRFAALLLVALLVVVPGVEGHANFVASEPPQGARLAAAPDEVRVILSQDIDPAGSALRVLDANGTRVDNDDLLVEPGAEPVLSVTLESPLGDGAYRVEWKALSRVDHHTTQGTLGFAVGNFTPPDATESTSGSLTPASLVGRSVLFFGLFLAVASILFSLIVAKTELVTFLQEVDRLAWPLIVAGSAVLLGDAVSRTDLAPSQWFQSDVLQDLLLRLVLAIVATLAALVLRPGAPVRLGGLSMGAAVLAFYSARSGHASASGALWMIVDTIHLLATACWVGGLVLLGWILLAKRHVDVSDEGLARMGRRFSRIALVCVITMALTGILLGITILGLPPLSDPFGWVQGLYGTALLGKILLALAMVALASVNRFVLLGRFVAGLSRSARSRFGGFVVGEASVGIVVLLLAAVLTSSSPPYIQDESDRFEITGEGAEFSVVARAATPPSAGAFTTLEFQITWTSDGSILQNDTCGRPRGCILLEVVPPGAEEHDEDETDIHHGGEHRVLEPRGDGWWIVPDVLFVDEGEYEFLVEIQTEYVFLDVVEMHLEVGNGEHDEHTRNTPANA